MSVLANDPRRIAERILRAMFKFRRIEPHGCVGSNCELCIAPHIESVTQRVAAGLPVQFMILAYPFKALSPAKVLGNSPDMAELVTLVYLDTICKDLAEIYAPGGQMIIAADGRVLADVIDGANDALVDQYASGIRKMIQDHHLTSLVYVTLDDLLPGLTPVELRAALPTPESRESIAERAKQDEELMYQLNGIELFASFELEHTRPELTKNQRKKRARDIAYAVISRGDSLRRVWAERYPGAVRCSIHPQKTHSNKIGIRMLENSGNWCSPWHGCAVVRPDGQVSLMKSVEAEAAGAELVYINQMPSHYVLTQSAAMAA